MDNNNVMDRKKQIRSILFLFIIMALTIKVFLGDYTLSEFLFVLGSSNLFYLAAGLAMMVLFVSCEALNLRMIMKALGRSVPFRKCLGYSNIGFYFSGITPSSGGGQPAQIYYMKKDQIPVSLSSITIFFVVFVYQAAMLSMGGILSVLRRDIAAEFASSLKYLLIYGIIMNVGACLIFFSLMFSKKLIPCLLSLIHRIGRKVRLIKRPEHIKNKLDEYQKSYGEKAKLLIGHRCLFLKVYFVSMIQMAALFMVPYFVYRSMGYHAYNILDIMTGQSLLTISVSAVPLPGATGAAEGGFLYAYGLFFPQDKLTAAMILSRIASFYLPMIISFIVYILIHIKTNKYEEGR